METLERLRAVIEQPAAQIFVGAVVALQIGAALTIPSVLLRRRGRPTSALLWLVVLLTLPPVGLVSWWLIGRSRIERRLRKHNRKRRTFSEQREAPATERGTRFDNLLPSRAYEDYAFNSSGNCVRLLADGQAAFPELERRLKEAKECVHFQFYLFRLDSTGERICRALIECRGRGVEVRVLIDGIGSYDTEKGLKKRLLPHGIEVAVFFPARFGPLTPRMNFVNHRKIVTIDNQVSFIGGMNIGREYETEWRDLMMCIDGPATRGLNHIFLEDWYLSTQVALNDPLHEPVANREPGIDAGVISSGPDTEDWIHDAYFLAITQATERLYLCTPYFIPTQSLLTALRTAAGRGVDVRLLLPSLSDVRLVMWASRSFYRPLTEAGVRIFEYGHAMVHAKALVKDRDICAVGSANLDNRSFKLNFEISGFFADEAATNELAAWMQTLIDASHEVTSKELDRTSLPKKLLESAAHLMSPLL